MKKVCVVVDGVNGLTSAHESKIIRLASDSDNVSLVINAYNPYLERIDFVNETSCSGVRQDYAEMLGRIKNNILERFRELSHSKDIQITTKMDIANYLCTHTDANALIVLAIRALNSIEAFWFNHPRKSEFTAH